MIRLLSAFLLVLCMSVAHAEPQQNLVLDRPGDPSPVILPLPAHARITDCAGEAILNFYCLRTGAAHEADVLSNISDGILARGWSILGEDRKSRPFTFIFDRPAPGVACPLLIMMTSNTQTQPGRPVLGEGEIEIQLTKTVDVRCVFG